MNKYRKKPMLIEAVLWDGTLLEGVYPITFFKQHNIDWHYKQQHYLVIDLIDGQEILVRPNDYIINDGSGMRTLPQHIFESIYEKIDE